MTHFEHYHSGDVYGIRYWFDAAGDCIPAHAHLRELAHNIIVLSGSVMFSTEGEDARPLIAGTVFDFDWSVRHKITALERAEVLHIFLNGRPEGYERLPPQELKGILQ